MPPAPHSREGLFLVTPPLKDAIAGVFTANTARAGGGPPGGKRLISVEAHPLQSVWDHMRELYTQIDKQMTSGLGAGLCQESVFPV